MTPNGSSPPPPNPSPFHTPSPPTQVRIVGCGAATVLTALTEHIDISQIPQYYGGGLVCGEGDVRASKESARYASVDTLAMNEYVAHLNAGQLDRLPEHSCGTDTATPSTKRSIVASPSPSPSSAAAGGGGGGGGGSEQAQAHGGARSNTLTLTPRLSILNKTPTHGGVKDTASEVVSPLTTTTSVSDWSVNTTVTGGLVASTPRTPQPQRRSPTHRQGRGLGDCHRR